MDYVNAFWVGGLICSPLPDFNGKDENAAGTDYGAIGMFRSCFGEQSVYIRLSWNLQGREHRCHCWALAIRCLRELREAVDTNGFIGIFMGGFTATAVGISAALVFAYLASLIFEPKMKSRKSTQKMHRKG